MSESLPSPTFCIMPWTASCITTSGKVTACCAISDLQNAPDINKVSINEALNSQYFQQIRQTMIAGKVPTACQKCFNEECANIESLRLRRNRGLKKLIPHSQEQISSQPMGIRYLDLRLGNGCNLKCRMCTPEFSKGLAVDWKKLEMDFPKIGPSYNWPHFDQIWQDLQQHLDSINYINLAGGEPSIEPYHHNLLQACIDTNTSSHIAISYNTNLQKMIPHLERYLKHFKNISIVASVDGWGPLNSYIRYPSQWEQIEKNFNLLQTLRETYNNLNLSLAITVQAYNILHLPQIIKNFLIHTDKPEINSSLHLNILHSPSYLSIQVLPEALKKISEERILSCVDWLSSTTHSKPLTERLLAIKKFLFASELFSSEFDSFIKVTKYFDNQRHQKLGQIIPEFAEFL